MTAWASGWKGDGSSINAVEIEAAISDLAFRPFDAAVLHSMIYVPGLFACRRAFVSAQAVGVQPPMATRIRHKYW